MLNDDAPIASLRETREKPIVASTLNVLVNSKLSLWLYLMERCVKNNDYKYLVRSYIWHRFSRTQII